MSDKPSLIESGGEWKTVGGPVRIKLNVQFRWLDSSHSNRIQNQLQQFLNFYASFEKVNFHTKFLHCISNPYYFFDLWILMHFPASYFSPKRKYAQSNLGEKFA